MDSSREVQDGEHKWTKHEMYTLVCLMCKGMHVGNHKKRKDDPEAAKKHAYLNVATELNKALNGKDFDKDISPRDVTKKIDEIASDKGFYNLLKRSPVGKLTRTMRLAFQRRPRINFDGTVFEWEHGRKAIESEKRLVKMLNAGVAKDGNIGGPIRQSIEGNDFQRMPGNKRPNQRSRYVNRSRAPAQYPTSLSYGEPVKQSGDDRAARPWVPPPASSHTFDTLPLPEFSSTISMGPSLLASRTSDSLPRPGSSHTAYVAPTPTVGRYTGVLPQPDYSHKPYVAPAPTTARYTGDLPRPDYSSHVVSIAPSPPGMTYSGADYYAATDVDKFFAEMDREISFQPSLASTRYVSTGRQEMIDAAANAGADSGANLHTKEKYASAEVKGKGANSTSMSFNRLERK